MKPAPPEGWVNKMDELEEIEREKKKKKKGPEGGTWHSGIFSCCSDPSAAAVGCVAPCLLFGMAKQEVGESMMANLLAMLCVMNPCFLLCFFRENIRSQYAIKGSPYTDCALSCFCFPCTLCQLYHHLKNKPLMKQGPNNQHGSSQWSSGLCSCADDVPLSLLVCAGFCCAFGILKRKMGQDPALNCCCGFLCGNPCVYGCANRGTLRAKYGIESHFLVDCCVWTITPCCAMCQEVRHLKRFPYLHKIVDKMTRRVMAAPTTVG
mmetsp:Transcript_20480/g.50314  ORF Transcript_20480/g.50314 Transcript_20480/m.50314 type:complete len:264 (+) Transcript_20480:91-882(+)